MVDDNLIREAFFEGVKDFQFQVEASLIKKKESRGCMVVCVLVGIVFCGVCGRAERAVCVIKCVCMRERREKRRGKERKGQRERERERERDMVWVSHKPWHGVTVGGL